MIITTTTTIIIIIIETQLRLISKTKMTRLRDKDRNFGNKVTQKKMVDYCLLLPTSTLSAVSLKKKIHFIFNYYICNNNNNNNNNSNKIRIIVIN